MNNICVSIRKKAKNTKGELSPKKQRMQMLIFTFTFTKVRDDKVLHTLTHNVGFEYF